METWIFRNLYLIWTENISILKFPVKPKFMKVVILKKKNILLTI